jgi:MFS superfamily sulfate permease-like transporter
LAVLRSYQRSWLRGDVIAGVTVAAYLVPQVMAYAAVAGLPPVAGLWAILPCLLLYSVFGSSRQLSVGPESTTAVLTASIVAPLAAGDAGRYAGVAAQLALVFGLLCFAAWLLRLGFVAELLSRPVLVGYICGVAVIMAAGQLDKVTGIPVKGATLWTQGRSLLGHLGEFRPATAAVAAGTVALLVLLHRYWPSGPAALIAVVVMTVLVAAFGLARHGVVLTGTFSGGLPRPRFPPTGQLTELLLPAIGILIVGYTDNILTARSFASQAGYGVDANQELLALGACNVGSSLVGGFPVSSSASRTALGAAAGSRTHHK